MEFDIGVAGLVIGVVGILLTLFFGCRVIYKKPKIQAQKNESVSTAIQSGRDTRIGEKNDTTDTKDL